MKADAVVRLRLPSQRRLSIILKALEPEVSKPLMMRSRAFLEKDDTFLILKIEARDTVALRAAVNAYLRWVNSIVNVLETLENVSQ